MTLENSHTKANSKAIAVLGMHRSGTSLITRVVNLMGAYLGEEKDLMKPSPDNPEGYWEREDIALLNERMLQRLNLSWHSPLPPPEGWVDEAEDLEEEIKELIKKHLIRKPLWAWKDPRTTLLFPLWRRAIEAMGVGLSVVFVVRNPLDVAKSLKRRDGFSLDKGMGMWFNYNLCGLLSLKGVPTVVVSYESFLASWKKEVERLHTLFKDTKEDISTIYNRVKPAVRQDLQHSASSLEELEQEAPLKEVVELYSLLIELSEKAGPQTDVASSPLVSRLEREFFGYARFYREDMAEALRLRDVESRLNALLNSRSWKITEPLRRIMDILKR